MKDLMTNPIFNMGLGILGANTPGATFGQAVGTGGLLGMTHAAAMQRAQDQARARQMDMQQAQIAQQAQARLAEQSPQLATVLQAYPNAAPQMLAAAHRAPTEAPSTVREWQYFQTLGPEEQERYLTMKRAQQWLNTGTAHVAPSPTNPTQPVATVPIQPPPESAPEYKGEQAQATAAGTARGKAQVEAVSDLPNVIEEATTTIGVIDKMISHPGLPYAVGKSSVLPVIPGTPPADFMALAEQLEGKAFLQAYQSLKGGGVITEVEGQKATAALGRLNRAQTEKEYKTALADLRGYLQRGLERAKRKAGATTRGAPSGSQGDGFRILD